MQKINQHKSTIKNEDLNNSNDTGILTDSKKVDINILLNRVKIDKKKEANKNILIACIILLALGLSAYIIFN
jgi:hypothetical protein